MSRWFVNVPTDEEPMPTPEEVLQNRVVVLTGKLTERDQEIVRLRERLDRVLTMTWEPFDAEWDDPPWTEKRLREHLEAIGDVARGMKLGEG